MNRLTRTVALGFALGLMIAGTVLGQAQEEPIDAVSGEPIPLHQAFLLLASGLGYGFIGTGLPEENVTLNFRNVDARQLIASYSSVYGLCHSFNDSAGALMVYPPIAGECPQVAGTTAVPPSGSDVRVPERTVRTPGGSVINVYGESPSAASGGAPVEPAVPTSWESFNVRLRLLEINEQRGLALGIDWGRGVFSTAAELVAGVADFEGGALPTASLDEVITFLETESIARRADDVTLATFEGEQVRFRSGGDVNVQLVGSGEQNISKTFQFGLIVDATPKRLSPDVVRLDYSVQDVDPGNVSDPTLITRNSQDISGAQPMRCGESVVIGQFVRQRGESEGSGLPALSRVPLAGYVAGSGSTIETLRMYVLTLDLECRSVGPLEAAR